MSIAIRSSFVDHTGLDGTGDAINGNEVDENPNVVADILDGTLATDLAGAGTLDFVMTDTRAGIRLIDLSNAAAAIHEGLVLEWDPGDGGNLTDNSSGIGIDFKLPDDADAQTVFGSLNVVCVDDAAASTDGEFSFRVTAAGTDNVEQMTLSAAALTVVPNIIGTIDGTSTLADGVVATTQSASDNSTKVATTAYADAAATAAGITFNNDANNRIVTGDGSGGLNGEANLTFDGTTMNVVGNAGVGIARTDGTLHVHTATAGAVTASTSANDLVVENSGDSGISILAPHASSSLLLMGSPVDDNGFQLEYDHTAGVASFDIGGSTDSLVMSGGSVGINESSPDTHLHVNGAYSSAQGTVKLQSNDNDAAKLTFWNKDTSPNADSRRWGIATSQGAFGDFQIQNGTSSTGDPTTARMTIDKDGNVGIAMTPSGSHKIDVTGSAGLSTGTAWTNTSDRRIKTDVQEITGALAKIEALRPVNFLYTDDYLSVHPELDGAKRYNSFIAQEYGEVFPDAVTNQGDLKRQSGTDEDGRPVYEVILSDVQQFTPHDLQMYLVAGMKELVVRVAALEAV
jgi:hypothetical protein